MGNILASALRQPPPPSRCLLIDSKKANPSNSMIDSLLDELLIEILVSLSADEIYDNARLVCRRWRHLIQTDAFVREHFHRASSGLLLQLDRGKSPIFVTATTQGRVQISKLSRRIKFPILCSCNGLVLCLRGDGSKSYTPFIFNPATNRAFDLPVSETMGQLLNRLGMAYAAASMAYKVFGLYYKSGIPHFVILTVGVDNTWRHVAVEGLSAKASWMTNDRYRGPLTTGCLVHWVSETHVASLNVETEVFTETPFPAHMSPLKKYLSCLSTGEYLSLFIPRGDWSWEVWEMKPETWEWRKVLPNLDLEAHKCKIQQFASEKGDVLKPVGWVKYPEVLAFYFIYASRSCIIYNLGTKEIDSIELSCSAANRFVVQHRNSLVWLDLEAVLR